MNAYNPTDTIVSVLKSIQDSVAWQRQQLMDQLLERASNLRYNNSVITREINQMLRNIEEEEMEASLERVYKKGDLPFDRRNRDRLRGNRLSVPLLYLTGYLTK